MNVQVDRLWRILKTIRTIEEPRAAAPNLKDTLFVLLLLETAGSEERFRRCLSANRALQEWAAGKTDAEISYWMWLNRGQLAA